MVLNKTTINSGGIQFTNETWTSFKDQVLGVARDNVVSISLESSNITDAQLIELTNQLAAQGTNFFNIDLSYTNIGDNGAIALSHLPNLMGLTIFEVRGVNQAGAQALIDNQHITYLDLRYTNGAPAVDFVRGDIMELMGLLDMSEHANA